MSSSRQRRVGRKRKGGERDGHQRKWRGMMIMISYNHLPLVSSPERILGKRE
jgi:hypothetical protein